MTLCIDNLVKSFGKKNAIDNLSLELKPGTYGLLGPNGAGKTTLIRSILGLYSNYKGQITFDNKKVKNYIEEGIGYLPQEFDVFADVTVWETMSFFCSLHRIKKSDRASEIERVLNIVNLGGEKNKRGKELSGGMKRRVGIAQALLGNSKMILLDEPTTSLDPEERENFLKLIKCLNNKIVIISTHHLSDVIHCCSDVIIIDAGRLRYKGDMKDFIALSQGPENYAKNGFESNEELFYNSYKKILSVEYGEKK